MPTVDHGKEPNQTVAKLHMSLDTAEFDDVKDYVISELETVEELPSGGTITKGIGVWLPDDHENEVEDNFMIEMWADTMEELEAIRELKTRMEEKYDQHCVCLKIMDVVMEHQ